MSDHPLVSIVLTSFNQPDLLEKAFDSLITQTYTNIEIIIVDDCSTNPLNKELIYKFHLEFPDRVRYIIQSENIGIARNKNSGFRMASGEFITYLDGDDYYFPEKIATEVALFKKKPDLDVVYTNFIFTNPAGEFVKQWAEHDMPEGYIFKYIVREEFPEKILFRCELIKSNIFKSLNFYDDDFKIYHDWDFRIRYAISGKIGYSPEISNVYRRTDESITIRSSFTQLVSEKLLVLKKNRQLIEGDIQLKDFYKNFEKEAVLDTLFDTHISFFKYFVLCCKASLSYPSTIITVIKSVYHRFFRKKISR